MSEWPAQVHTDRLLIAQAAETTTAHASTSEAHTAPHAEAEAHVSPTVFFGLSLFALLVIVILAIAGLRRTRLVPQGMQNLLELLVESLYGLPEMVMGPRGRQYAPFISTFFLYILVMNLTGLIPGLKSGTASLSVTLGLSIVAFIAIQYFGFRTHGIKYLAHFMGPVPAMAILILPLELISELIRPLSLSIRLFGNISGEEQVVEALANRIYPLAAVLMLPFQVLTSVLQALVFSLLVTVYISLATEKHDADEHTGPAGAQAHST